MKRNIPIYILIVVFLLISTANCDLSLEDIVKDYTEQCGEDPRNSGSPTQAEIDKYVDCITNL